MASLFTSQTPASGDNSDGTPGITTATTMRFAVDGEVTAIRFFATVTVGGTYTGALYQVTAGDRDPGPGTGTLLASKVLGSAPSSAAWNLITFDTPVAVTAGTQYRAAMFSGSGRYVNTNNFTEFVSGGLTNGNITADADGTTILGATLTQGAFQIDSILNYPRTTGSDACYFIDVAYTADTLAEAHPAGIAVPVGLTAPDITLSPASPTGIAVSVALGDIDIGGPPSTHPSGIAVAVLLGDPGFTVPPEPAVSGGSWWTLLSIYETNAQFAREEREAPVACPNDGEPLERDPRGKLRCPYDGWTYEGV